MAIIKDVWKTRDNEFGLIFEATDPEGIRNPVDMDKVTRTELELEGSITVAVNANSADAPIDWWSSELLLVPGEMRFELGDDVVSVPAGVYAARITLFSLTEPGGIVWTSWARQELLLSIHETSQSGAAALSDGPRQKSRFWGLMSTG